MNYIKNVGDNQNKFGDTATVFKLGLMKDDEVYNFGDNQVTVNIANETGYVLSVTPDKVLQNTVLNLDFNKVPLKNLTPDSYQLEVEVKSTDGDIAKFPTSGAMTFSINHDLKETSGELVPTVTFDNVLDAVDEKIAVYMNTVKVGPEGPVGPAGNVDTSHDNTFTGANTFTQLINGYNKTKSSTSTDLNSLKTPGKYEVGIANANTPTGMPNSAVLMVETNTAGTVIYQFVLSRNTVATNADINVFMRMNIDSTWTPWRTFATDDSVLVHKTGTEVIAGDKTFTGNSNFTGPTTLKAGNYGLRVTSTGIQKTSDSGTTWTSI